MFIQLFNSSELYTSMPEKKPTATFNDATRTITIDYVKEPIVNILYFLQDTYSQHIEPLNIIHPHGSATLKETVTFKSTHAFTIEELYEWVISLLDQIGYIVTKRPNTLMIGQKNPENLREPVELYINTPLEEIPDSDIIIRYIYYLENSKISLSTDAEFNVLVKEFLSPTSVFRVDINANAYVMADRARNIKTVVTFLNELDKPIQQEAIEFVHLKYAEAPMVAQKLQELINTKSAMNPDTETMPKGPQDNRKQSDLLFFAKGTKIFPILHNNTIMLIGKQQAIDQIKTCVKDLFDQSIGSGIPTIHTLQLQYTDANTLVPTLQRVVESSRAGGTGQSEATSAQTNQVKGNERLFNEFIIESDKPSNPEDRQYYGGNNLIFGCTHDDFIQIKQLIQELDVPRPLILLEIAIADLSIDDNRLLGAITRSPDKLALLSSMQFQTAHTGPGIVVDNYGNPTTLHSDLLSKTVTPGSNGFVFASPDNATNSIASSLTPGSTAISLNDQSGKTWSMLQILKLFKSSQIIQHPHVITLDNKQAIVSIGESRLLKDETTSSASGVAVQQQKQIDANLAIEITPRKSGYGDEQTVNMKIKVTIDSFTDKDGNKTTRATATTVNIKSGSIFAIAGLSRVDKESSLSKSPLVGDIPLLGLLGKKQSGNTTESNLTIFISPTIIEPRLRAGIGEHTKSYIDIAKDFSHDNGLFENSKDPITRWFFNNNSTDTIEGSLNHFAIKTGKRKDIQPAEELQLANVSMPAKNNPTDDLKVKLHELDDNPFNAVRG